MIKEVKIKSIWVNDEREVTKKDGTRTKVCDVNITVAEDDKNYANKYIKLSFWDDVKYKRVAKEQADYFKSQNEGQTVLLDITEEEWESGDKKGVNLVGKRLSKAKREAYEDIKKEMGK